MRYGSEEKRRAKLPKGKKVPAGMSYTPDTTEEEGEEDDVDQILESNFRYFGSPHHRHST